jgi:zinc D-Ala-D-Ala carboxypeptidase
MKLSANFDLSELTRSGTAQRLGISNQPTPEHLESLKLLCENILQPLRENLGRPIRVNSGYRSEALNMAVPGSSPKSQHCRGEAADIEVDRFPNKDLAQKIIDLGLPFDQLILEFYVPGEPNSGWVHVSHKPNGEQRGQVLRAIKQDGKLQYLTGLE